MGPRIIDVSLPISPDMLIWPSNMGIQVVPNQRIADGSESNSSELRLGTHTGTHVDPPLHFVDGAGGVDTLALDVLVGEAFVADLRHLLRPLEPADLEGASVPDGTERLLLRTGNSDMWTGAGPREFPDTYACLTGASAAWVVERGIRLVGIDFLGIEQRGATGHPAHHTLLENGVIILEGLNLSAVEPGRTYRLICLPLRLMDGDGGPARTVLIDEGP
jgi:arylformamidase